ncbi:MAG TPA: hypothetical protein VGS07_18110 [Thermoanaerobaculia bacterium]|jgi:hypothetical protein|nr:hypothetical protein [Thermoanaerobaculia bacterium]
MLPNLDVRNARELNPSPFLYVKNCPGRVELNETRDTQIFCGYYPAGQLEAVGFSHTAIDFNFPEEVPWAPKRIDTVKRESMKKGAGRVAQRRTDNKHRMMRRQLPGDAYVWETDSSPGIG